MSKAKFDIVWLGQGKICENGYKFTPEGSKAIVKFVEEDGICINAEQDHDDNVEYHTMDWFPVKMNGGFEAELEGWKTYGNVKKSVETKLAVL